MELIKRDMVLAYGGRTFAVRAYRDGSDPVGRDWHTLVIENRTPLRHEQQGSASPADCFAGAVRFVTTLVEAQTDEASPRA